MELKEGKIREIFWKRRENLPRLLFEQKKGKFKVTNKFLKKLSIFPTIKIIFLNIIKLLKSLDKINVTTSYGCIDIVLII